MKNQLIVGLLSLGLTASLYAADKPKKMTPEQQAMMEKMQKYSTPNENHQRMEPLVGRWTYVTRMWMKPGDKPQEAPGTMDMSWQYGKRFVKGEFKSAMEGQPMEGVGYMGYDNLLGEYQTIWLGSMGTGIMQGRGSYDMASRTFQFNGTYACPMTGEKARTMRSDWQMVDNDNMVFTMYDKGPDGKEFKSMVETYKRVK